jgi:hypothetical protein
MAKSSRASVKKRNNRQLAKRVFGPVEAARNERLSAKLMELASQPKPEREVEMMVDGKSSKSPSLTDIFFRFIIRHTDKIIPDATTAAESEEVEKATDSAEGQSLALHSALAYPIPISLSRFAFSGGESSSEEGSDVEEVSMACHGEDGDDVFYHLLGLSTDIAGFSHEGDLRMLF